MEYGYGSMDQARRVINTQNISSEKAWHGRDALFAPCLRVIHEMSPIPSFFLGQQRNIYKQLTVPSEP